MPYNNDIRRDTRMREERARERLRDEREGRRGRRYPGVGALYGPYPMIGEGLYPQYRATMARTTTNTAATTRGAGRLCGTLSPPRPQ